MRAKPIRLWLFLLIIVQLLFSSCTIQKRRYNRGFYIEVWNGEGQKDSHTRSQVKGHYVAFQKKRNAFEVDTTDPREGNQIIPDKIVEQTHARACLNKGKASNTYNHKSKRGWSEQAVCSTLEKDEVKTRNFGKKKQAGKPVEGSWLDWDSIMLVFSFLLLIVAAVVFVATLFLLLVHLFGVVIAGLSASTLGWTLLISFVTLLLSGLLFVHYVPVA